MSNINIKAKKTRSLNKIRYIEVKSKYDMLYANIYCLLASKRTNKFSKNELKKELANMYDARFNVSQNIDNNIICIRYYANSILDQFLPNNVSDNLDELFDSGFDIIEYSDQEIIEAAAELGLYTKNYFDNKQNIANNHLHKMINGNDLKLDFVEIIEFYDNPDFVKIRSWINDLSQAEEIRLDFNNGDDDLKSEHTKLDFKYNQYIKSDPKQYDLNLDQTYVAIAYKLNSTDLTINNLLNLILGGGVYSKIFKIIREELSLSYNIRSSLANENLITISGGVNNQKLDLALDEIDKILEILKRGDFDNELELAKTNYIENLKRSKTSEMSYLNMYGSNYLKQTNRTHDSIIKEVEEATKEDILEAILAIEKLTMVFVK